ncbi:uncharacterized protein BO80DRAFT_8917 [Aspergillus ibericus CBS 121593]|uniref:Uncharacterized protein n=1 Tax=Aspergillus ibericus CBS 121593 TaxID=1448316 RepID=A0A395HED9_9EURO|nr:hypothetical protein BO80DRAFT_8917 [Aspergillus ibericus CBS 121593]RAL06331.1 hypothetical protein BO80DRAFT_8917 [Aspergillus ibericus CBS 121593]
MVHHDEAGEALLLWSLPVGSQPDRHSLADSARHCRPYQPSWRLIRSSLRTTRALAFSQVSATYRLDSLRCFGRSALCLCFPGLNPNGPRQKDGLLNVLQSRPMPAPGRALSHTHTSIYLIGQVKIWGIDAYSIVPDSWPSSSFILPYFSLQPSVDLSNTRSS